jgi:hypothetical protein
VYVETGLGKAAAAALELPDGPNVARLPLAPLATERPTLAPAHHILHRASSCQLAQNRTGAQSRPTTSQKDRPPTPTTHTRPPASFSTHLHPPSPTVTSATTSSAMLAASLSLAALSLGSLVTSAAPIEPRIVETIECSPLDATYTLDGLFWASAAVDATLVPVGIAADGNATWAPSASDLEGQWTFEVCNSTIIKQCVCNGRLLAPHRGGVVCLGQVTDE